MAALDFLMDPANQGLLNLSAGLLQAGGPSPTPVSFGQALGHGVMQGLQGVQQAQKTQQTQALVGLELQKLKQAQAQFDLQQGILKQFGIGGQPVVPSATAAASPPGMSPSTSSFAFGTPQFASGGGDGGGAQPAGAFPFNPTQLAAMRLAGLPDLTGAYNASRPDLSIQNGFLVDKHDGIVKAVPQTNMQGFSTITLPDPSSPTGYRVAQVPGASEAYGTQQNIGEREKARFGLEIVPATAPNQPPTYRSRLDLLGGGGGQGVPAGMSPAAASQQSADAAQQTDIAKNYGKIYNDAQNAAMQNPTKMAKFERIGTLLGNFEGGKLSKLGVDIASTANSAGIKIDPKLPNKQAAEALTNEVALELRSTGEGNGMPGSMSDADREFLKSMTPQLAQTAEGRKTIIESRVKVMERENQVAKMARMYKQKYGKIDEDFFNQLSAWSARNPIFGAK